MIFENFSAAQSALLWSGFVIAIILGAVANKTNFCTMGAVSDMVNMGDWGRMRAWMLAMAVAVLGVSLLEHFGLASPDNAFPPYRSSQLLWAENILGGLAFGIGMTLASGCGNKTLIRFGGGNLKSLVVMMIVGIIAWFMVNPFPGSDQTLMSAMFFDWIRPLSTSLAGPQDLGTLLAADNPGQMRLIAGIALGLVLLAVVFKSADFRRSFDNILGGLVVGLAVLAAWYVSSNLNISIEGETVSLRDTVNPTMEYWDMYPDFHAGLEDKPDGAPLSPQSFTFINPIGQTAGYLGNNFDAGLRTFGVMAVFGVILGSFLWSVFSKSFRIEWFANVRDFITHVIGAVLMGFGGILAMGCTIGQGITGLSTLALGSFLALGGIIIGSAVTMKIQYQLMMRG
jgi:uncharacterized membrane protein YedE/YeeE